MPNYLKSIRVLLLQIRNDPHVRLEEYQSFVKYSGLDSGQIEILNVFDTPEFPPTVIDGYQGLFIGGASEASVMEPDRYPFLEHAKRLIYYCIDKDIPVFASCFGFQLAVVTLGGKLVRDEHDFEMGTIPILLTEASQSDPLFEDAANGFLAVAVHRERSVELPSGVQLLAYTHNCPHAFRIAGKPFWAFQFHPEVDRHRLVERLTIYKTRYTDNDSHLDTVIQSAMDTPEANALVGKFVSRVLTNAGTPERSE